MIDFGGLSTLVLAAGTFVTSIGALYLRAREDDRRWADRNNEPPSPSSFPFGDLDTAAQEAILEQLRKEERQAEIDELLKKRREREQYKHHDDDPPRPALLRIFSRAVYSGTSGAQAIS